jgi:hypothetical protein
MKESTPGEAAGNQAAGDPAAPRPAGASARLPWRYAEIGRRRLAGIAAGRAARAKGRNGGRNGVDIDDHIRLAVREETAATLGRAGRKLQAAVLALADFDRAAGRLQPLSPARRPLLREASLALWECVVQREAIGLTNHDLLEQLYGVTPELWRLMGTADVAGA